MSNVTLLSVCESEFFEALRSFSKTLSEHGATDLDKLMLTALSHKDVQSKFIARLSDNQIFLNAQSVRIPDLSAYSRMIFNFSYLPPKLSLLSLSFSVIIDNNTGTLIEIMDPYHIKMTKNMQAGQGYGIGAINRIRI